MLNAIHPVAFVNTAVRPVHLSVPITQIVLITTFIGVPAGPVELAVALLSVHKVLPFIPVGRGVPALRPLAMAMLHPVHKLAFINRVVLPGVLAVPVSFAKFVAAEVDVPIDEDVSALAVLETVLPVTFVLIPVAPDVHAFAVGAAVLPLADVVLAFDSPPDAVAVFQAAFPLAINDYTVAYPS